MASDFAIYDEENYTLRNRKEILQILSKLKEDADTLKIAFNHNKEDYLTPIFDVDADNNALLFDMSVDDAFNKRLLASQDLSIEKESGVRIKWHTNKHTMVQLSDGNALRTELPESLIRLQRRELFRLKTPLSKPLRCNIKVPNAFDRKKTDTIHYDLVDVSLGGVGLIVKKKLHPSIKVGDVYEDCKIDLPTGEVSLTLEVRNIIHLSDKTGDQYRIGLQYIDISRGVEHAIHNYTFNLEREMLKAKNGL